MTLVDKHEPCKIVAGEAMVFSIAKVAAELRITVLTLNRWIQRGEFPVADYKVGRHDRWSADTVTEWLGKNR